MLYLRKNFGKAFVAATIGISDTSMTVLAGGNLPTTAGNFIIVVWNNQLYSSPSLDPNAEFMIAVYASANTYTITRAQEGTAAVPHAINDTVSMVLSAALSIADLSILGTKEIDETAIANNYVPYYDSGSGKLKYANPTSLIPASTTGLQLFTSSGTFTVPAGITKVYLTMIGGGCAGGATGGHGGGGGSSAPALINYPYAVIAGNSYTVTIGAGGVGAAYSNGTDGGSTTFDTLTIAGGKGGVGGGAGGASVSATAANGVTGGGYNFQSSMAGGVGAATNNGNGGGGGGSLFGIGGNGATFSGGGTAGSDGAANTGVGGGGASGDSGSGSTGQKGGNGGSGFVLVQY